MRADDLLGTLAARGVAVTRRGAKLHITGRTSAVTQAEWARLRDFKGEILAALPDGDPDAGGAGQFWAAHPGAAAADPRWPELIPLDADERPAFPLEALLVDALADHARAVAFTHQVPVDYPALLDVGVCSGALAGKAEVWVGDTFLEPLNGYFAVFGQTGERKGPPFREATAPVREWERERAEATKAERIKARNAYDVEEERIADLKRRAGKEDDPTRRAKLLAAVDEIESDRTALIPEPVLIADDVTPEKLAMLLADQGERLIVASEEAGTLLAIAAGKYTRGGDSDLDLLLKGHDGSMFKSHRVGRAPVRLERPLITLLLSPQPELFRKVAREHGDFEERGAWGRVHIGYPVSLVGTRLFEDRPLPAPVRRAWRGLVRALLELQPAASGEPHALRIVGPALEAWREGQHRVERELGEGGRYEHVRPWANKLHGKVARLTGVLHLARHGEAGFGRPIEEETVLAAWAIGDYELAHVLALYGFANAGPMLALARRVAGWIARHRPERFTLARLYQDFKSSPTLTKSTDLLPATAILEDRHHVRAMESRAEGAGRPPAHLYAAHPSLLRPEKPDNARTAAGRFPGFSGQPAGAEA